MKKSQLIQFEIESYHSYFNLKLMIYLVLGKHSEVDYSKAVAKVEEAWTKYQTAKLYLLQTAQNSTHLY